MRNDNRLLAGSERRLYGSGQIGQVNGAGVIHRMGTARTAYLNLHERAGVGPVAWQSRERATGVGVVIIAGEVIQTQIKRRHRCRCIVVHQQSGAGEVAKVNHDIGTFGRAEQQGMFLDIGNDDIFQVVLEINRLVFDDYRRRYKAAISANLNHRRTASSRIEHARGPTIKRYAAFLHGIPPGREA